MKPELRALIVDDEAPAREVLSELLENFPHVRVVGEATSVATAVSLCADLKPNLIFLDVQMRDGEGFSVLPQIAPLPSVIFVTAYDKFAARAFEVNAVDYLLKPVSQDRLAHALERILHQPTATKSKPFREDDRIFLKSDSGMRVAYVTEISGIEAQENYTRVYLANGTTEFLRRTMTEWEKVLPKPLFLRVHRSLIVNLSCVGKVLAEDRDTSVIEVTGIPKPIPLGRKPALRLRSALRLRNQV
ncbi:MAG: LytTR family DNA-binding domain-containing protein [Terrimicrobiaceae bacterium]